MQSRHNEQPRTRFRSERFYHCNGQWYFHTREGVPVGPYVTRFDAEVDAQLLVAQLRDTPAERAGHVIRNFVLSSSGDLDYLNDPAFTSYLTRSGSGALARRS